MSRRYVFWRTPTGEPYRGEDGKHAPAAILRDIGEDASVGSDGAVHCHGFITFPYAPILRAMAVVLDPEGGELNETDAWPILRRAIIAVIKRQGGAKPIAPTEVIAEANKQAAEHFRKTPTDFVVVSSLSVKSLLTKRVRVRGCEISMIAGRTNRYPYPDCLKHQAPAELVRRADQARHQAVAIKTTSRTSHEAISNALRALDLLRGVWTLLATSGSRTWNLAGAPKPICPIMAGPVHTLHYPDGRLVADGYWYNPNWTGVPKAFEPRKGWEKLESDRRWVMKRLQHHSFQAAVEDLLIRYAGALENPDHSVCFLHLWGILERLSDTVGGKYEETISRISWVFGDRQFARETLEALRCARNRYVHAAHSGDERDQIVYEAKLFVDDHLLRLIRNDFKTGSLREHAGFLALPTDLPTLDTHRQKYARAAQTLRRWHSEQRQHTEKVKTGPAVVLKIEPPLSESEATHAR